MWKDHIRLARTEGDIEYFVGERGKSVCLFLERDGRFDSATCNPRANLIDEVIYLISGPDSGVQTMDLSGVASDAVAEVTLGEKSDEPEANVWVIDDAPLEQELTITFEDGTETTVDLGSLPFAPG